MMPPACFRTVLLVALAWLVLANPVALSRPGQDRFTAGEAAFRQGDSSAALEAFRAFLSQDPDGPRASEATWKLAVCLDRLHRESEARVALEDWLSQGAPDPWRVRGWILLGELRARKGPAAPAEQAYAKALALAGTLPQAGELRAEALLGRGRLRAAAPEFRTLRTRAEEDLVDALRLDGAGPQGQAARLALGQLYLDNPQTWEDPLGRAVEVWRELVRLDPRGPQAPEARLRLARALEAGHRDLEARDELEVLARDFPGLPQGKEARKALREMLEPRLQVLAEPTRLPGQPPRVTLRTRNVGPVQVSTWRVDLLEAFAKTRDLDAVARDFQPSGEPLARAEHGAPDPGDHAWREEQVLIPVPGSGTFVVRARSGDLQASALVVVSRLAVIRSAGPRGEAVAWLVDAEEGKAADAAEALLARGRKTPEAPYDRVERLPVKSGGLVDLPEPAGPGGSLLLARRGQDVAFLADPREGGAREAWRSFLYTDRSAYRPGERVRWKAALRALRTSGPEVPAGRPFLLEVRDSRGRAVQEGRVAAGSLGTVQGEFPLPETAPRGRWTVVLRSPEEPGPPAEVGSCSFRVERATGADLQVTLRSRRPWYLAGERAEAEVEVRDSRGRAVPAARVDWTVARAPLDPRFPVEPSLEGFALLAGPALFVEVPGIRGLARTDAAGRTRLALPVTPGLLGGAGGPGRVLQWRARVVDGAGRSGEGAVEVPAAEAGLFLDVGLEGTPSPGQPVDVRVQARDLEGRPAPAEVDVDLVRGEERQALGRLRLDPQGRGTLEWRPPEAGPARLEVSAAGSRGPRVRATRVVGPVSGAPGPLGLVVERDRYKPGEVASVLLRTPRAGVDVLLTLEGREVIRRMVLSCPSTETRLQLPLGEDLVPSFRIRALAVLDHALASQEVEVRVPDPSRLLAVRVEPLEPPVAGRPGRLRITTRDASGQPAEAEVSLALVGPGERPASGTPSLPAWFQDPADGPSPTLASSLAPPAPSKPAPAAPAGAADPERFSAPPLQTAFWSSDLRTGPQGRTELALTWPSSPGTWALTARAVGSRGRMGEGVADLALQPRLPLRLAGPQFLTEGDTARFTVLAGPAGDRDLALRGLVRARGLRVESEPESELVVPARGVGRWNLEVAAPAPAGDEGGLEVTLRAPDLEETLQSPVLLLPAGLVREEARSGSLEGTARVQLPAPPAGASHRRLDVELSPGLAGLLGSTAAHLANAPGTSEGLIARAVPAARVARAMRDHSLPPAEFQAGLTLRIEDSLRELGEAQHGDGGWGWWPEAPSEPRMTSWVLQGLADLRRADGAAGEPGSRLVERGAAWLVPRLGGLAPEDRAAALHALAAHGRAPSRALRDLVVRARDLSTGGRLHLAMALHRAGRSAEALRLLKAVLQQARPQPPSWPAGGGWTTVETSALALEACLALQPRHPQVAPLAAWLVRQRGRGGWGTVRETAMATGALATWLTRVGEEPSSFGYGIWLGGNEVEAGRRSAEQWSQSWVVTLTGAQLPEGPLQLELRKAGPGVAWWCASQSFVSGTPGPPAGPGLQRRQFLVARSGRRTPLKEGAVIRVGDVVETVLEFRTDAALRDVIVEDRAPAGLEVLPPPAPRRDSHVVLQEAGPVFYLPEVSRGTCRVTWRGRAVRAGEFLAAPARVRFSHAPEKTGSSSTWRVNVHPEAP